MTTTDTASRIAYFKRYKMEAERRGALTAFQSAFRIPHSAMGVSGTAL